MKNPKQTLNPTLHQDTTAVEHIVTLEAFRLNPTLIWTLEFNTLLQFFLWFSIGWIALSYVQLLIYYLVQVRALYRGLI